MASIAISGAADTSSRAVNVSAPGRPANEVREPESAKAPTLKPDTVKISSAAQAKLMHRQGQSVALIAATLGTNVKAVDGYLGIAAAAQVSTAPAAAPQAKPLAVPVEKSAPDEFTMSEPAGPAHAGPASGKS